MPERQTGTNDRHTIGIDDPACQNFMRQGCFSDYLWNPKRSLQKLMISRRNIRVKVMQTLYSIEAGNHENDPGKAVKALDLLIEQARHARAFSILAKPVTRNQISGAVHEALAVAYNWQFRQW